MTKTKNENRMSIRITRKFKNGNREVKDYDQGKRLEAFHKWSEDGTPLFTKYYKNGVISKHIEYYDNGFVKSENAFNGQQRSYTITYHENGKMAYNAKYHKGSIINSTHYYPNGIIKTINNFDTGYETNFDRNGIKTDERVELPGKKEIKTVFNLNGYRVSEFHYVKGKLKKIVDCINEIEKHYENEVEVKTFKTNPASKFNDNTTTFSKGFNSGYDDSPIININLTNYSGVNFSKFRP